MLLRQFSAIPALTVTLVLLGACSHQGHHRSLAVQTRTTTGHCAEPGATLDLLRAGWVHETHREGRALSHVRQRADGALVIDLDLRPGDRAFHAGEVFFELENLQCIEGPIDLNGAEINVEYEAAKDLLNGPTTYGQISIETENGDGETGKQYSAPLPTDYRRNRLRFHPDMLKARGHTDAGLDLEKAVAIGFKLSLGEKKSRGYRGAIDLTRVDLTLPSDEKRAEIKLKLRDKRLYERDEDSRISKTCQDTGFPEETPNLKQPAGRQLRGEWIAGSHVTDVIPQSQPGKETDVWRVYVRFNGREDTVRGRTAEVRYSLAEPFDARGKRIRMMVMVDKFLRGNLARPNWVHVALEDDAGRTMTGPGVIVSERACQWKEIAILPTVDTPMPLGNVKDGFDMRSISAIRVKFELGRFWSEIYRLESANPERLQGVFHVSPILVANAEIDYVPMKFVLEELPPCDPTGHPRSRDEFIVGVNYPWIHYGWDVGRNPSGERTSCGFSTHAVRLRKDFRRLHDAGVDLVRVFVFGDLRTGVVFNEEGYAQGLDECVRRDLRELFAAATEARLPLMLALLDYKAADGIERRERGRKTKEDDEGGNWDEGERPRVFIDAGRRTAFLDQAMRPFLRTLRDLNEEYGSLHSIDIANELGNAKAIVSPMQFPEVKKLVIAVASLTRQELPEVPLTLGTRSMPDLVRYWHDAPVDFRQFHYYDSFPEEGMPDLAKPAACIGLDTPVLVGELDPTGDVYEKLQIAYRNGYAGALFWSFHGRDGFVVDLSQIRRWKEGG